MGFLSGKRFLVMGMASSSSLAYGIARSCAREGAELAFTFQDDRLAKRVRKLADQLGSALCFPCNVSSDEQIDELFKELKTHWDTFDGVVHAIGFAPSEAISGDYFDGLSREAFRIAHDVSSYSFSALAKGAHLMIREGGSLLTLSFIGATRVMPSYNTMGLAKASLESSVKYLAKVLGAKGVRVNALSSAPIETIAASGLGEIECLLKNQKSQSFLKRDITIDDVGNAAAFLLSNLASGISGQVIYVDGGFSSA